MSDFLQSVFPTWQGFVWPTNLMEQLLVFLGAGGAALVLYTANLSIGARRFDEEENAYDSGSLCLDQLGELMYGVFTLAQLAVQFSSFTSQLWWLAVMPTYAY